MDEVRLEKLIEETLSTMDPVEVPKDLHFDAAKIMRLARMEEEEEAERTPAAIPFMDRVRQAFQSRSWTRYAAAAAAFVVLLGVYGIWRSGSVAPPLPGNDPAQTAEIDDGTIPLTPPDIPVEPVDPVQNEDPVTPDVPDEPEVTPQEPVQSAENPTPPVVTPPAPKPPQPKPQPQPEPEAQTPAEEPDDPPVEEEPDEVNEGTEYAGGNEIDPEEQIPDDATPAAPPEEQTGEEPADPEENEFEIMLEEALQDEQFAADFAAEDKGFGHNILDVQDVPEGTEFMVYFYESEEEQLAGTVNEDDVRSILWKKESL